MTESPQDIMWYRILKIWLQQMDKAGCLDEVLADMPASPERETVTEIVKVMVILKELPARP